MNKGKIILISGPSGVGKRTVLQQVIEDKDLNLTYSVSATTRQKRQGEVEGKDYFFLSKQDFDHWIKNNEFLEYAEFCGNYYGTPKQKVIALMNQGKNVLLEIEVVGAKNILNIFNEDEVVSIFLAPPSLEILKQRLVARGTESAEFIESRVKKASEELSFKHLYKNFVVNDDLQTTVNEVKQIIKKHAATN